MGKLIVALRVSTVLTAFLLFPPLLASGLLDSYWTNIDSMLVLFGIVLLTSLTNSVVGLFCSVCFRRTAMSQLITYCVLLCLYALPVALNQLCTILELRDFEQAAYWGRVLSPFAAAFAVPLDQYMLIGGNALSANEGDVFFLFLYFAGTSLLIGTLWLLMNLLFRVRWWVSQD